MKEKIVLPILLILSLIIVPCLVGQAQAQAQYSLGLEGLTWNHSTISVLVIPQDGASWWQPSYLNATLQAIGEWNNAIQSFALNYSNFAYLSKLRMAPTVSHVMNNGFDVCVSWTGMLSGSSGEIGLTQTAYDSSGIIINCTISLSVKDQYNHILNEIDMQNVALHEFGHSLGLGHSNYSSDIMYPTYTLNQPIQALSTLDLYGVSTVFQWMSNPSNSPHVPKQSSVALPPSITYQYLPISYADLQPPIQPNQPNQPNQPTAPSTTSPSNPFQDLFQTLLTYGQAVLSYILHFFLLPEILIPLLIAISAALATEYLVARIIHKNTPKQSLN